MALRGRTRILLVAIFAAFFAVPTVPTVDAGAFEAANSREVREIRSKVRAAQFLSKATFGPTEADIDALAARIRQIGYRRACSEWIDDQFDIPATSHRQTIFDIFDADNIEHDAEGFNVPRVRHQAWWDVALRSDDQLRQKFAWALSQIFVTSDQGNGFNNNDADFSGFGSWLGPTVYYDEVLVDNAFGNYRDLLGDMTFSPVMGTYLSHLRNRRASVPNGRFPDENYAREIMQLFSIGLYLLENDGRLKTNSSGNIIPTYTNEEIKTLARLFTGFKYNNPNSNIFGPLNLNEQMRIWAPEHDNNLNYAEDPFNPGQVDPNAPAHKRLFGTTLSPIPTNPTEQQVIDEINEGLDVLSNHPNVGPFICRLLIQRMVKSNPSRAYMRRVVRKFNDNGEGERGDFKAVVKAILLDPELYRSQRLQRKSNPLRVEVVTRGSEYSRLREPILRITSLIRGLNPSSDYSGGFMMLRNVEGDFGQSPYRSPSVFNFYLPEFQPPGEIIGFVPSKRNPHGALFAPEFQILDAVTANRTINRFQSWIRNRYVQNTFYNNGTTVLTNRITLDLDDEAVLAQDPANMPDLLAKWDLLFCCGSLSEQTKAAIIAALNQHASSTSSSFHAEVRLEEALLAVILSPDCAVEE